ncbi:MAG: 3'-5' exonuclease [Actinomycetota bacterium]
MFAVGGRKPPGPRVARGAAWRDARYVALDFETTGLDYATDHIVSYGVVPIEHARVFVGAARHQLVRPPTQPSRRSQTVHLLRPVDLVDAPDRATAALDLRAALAGRFVLAWFAQVEVAFLRGLYGGSERWWGRRVIDVRDLAIAVDRAPPAARRERGYALGATAKRYGIPVADPHNALDDALVTAQLFLVLVGKLPGRAPPTARDLARLSFPS